MFENEDYKNRLLSAAAKIENKERVKVIEFLEKRKVQHLLHFTEIKNLKSILNNGLLSKDHLSISKIEHTISDEKRLDLLTNSISLSIAFPNIKMLDYKTKNVNESEYVVLEISLNILYESNARYICMPGNAARTALKQDAWEFPEKYVGISGMERMFPAREYRHKRGAPANIPLDIQAEILFFNPILTNRIQKIHYLKSIKSQHPEIQQFLDQKHPEIQVCNNCQDKASLKFSEMNRYQEEFDLIKELKNGE